MLYDVIDWPAQTSTPQKEGLEGSVMNMRLGRNQTAPTKPGRLKALTHVKILLLMLGDNGIKWQVIKCKYAIVQFMIFVILSKQTKKKLAPYVTSCDSGTLDFFFSFTKYM